MKIANCLVLYFALIASTSQAAVIAVMDGGGPAATDSSHTTVVDLSTGGDTIGSVTGSFSAGPPGWQTGDSDYWNNTEYDFSPGSASVATWTFSNLTVGSQWDVLSTWKLQNNRSQAAPYTIQGGSPITINQELAPAADLVLNDGTTAPNSYNFQRIGTATVGVGGNVTVTLSGAADDWVIVDAIALRQIPEPSGAALLGLGGLALVLRRRK